MPSRLARWSRVLLPLLALAAAFAAMAACGGAEGVQACRTLESARCERAAACGISLDTPPHEGSPERDVEACKRYYRDACLHGLVSEKDPGEVAVEACRKAIAEGDCEIVRTPQSAAACAFLGEPPPAEDADDAGDAGDDLDGQSPF